MDGWRVDRKFQRKGQPRDLEISKPGPSFKALVGKYAGDIPHRAVLHELQRIGAVVINDGVVKLRIAAKRRSHRRLMQALRGFADAITYGR
jgi:hypothetical protein